MAFLEPESSSQTFPLRCYPKEQTLNRTVYQVRLLSSYTCQSNILPQYEYPGTPNRVSFPLVISKLRAYIDVIALTQKFVDKVMSYHYGGITSRLGSGDWLEVNGLYATICGASAKPRPHPKAYANFISLNLMAWGFRDAKLELKHCNSKCGGSVVLGSQSP
ncbi:hypothetical protein EMPG_11822 [Blastomyces silverae]|uniref:Uncharacterized protein n=1 Tax=Blastomyces silverae TaxID=2060906 RepID=A0A0H1BW06_9EURO|nr:hypothetical protein EMPG_11822 [Blastomyces silverae]